MTRQIIFVLLVALFTQGCTTVSRLSPEGEAALLKAQQEEFEYQQYLKNSQREQATQQAVEQGIVPNQELVEHTCKSTPIYNINGQFIRTHVACW